MTATEPAPRGRRVVAPVITMVSAAGVPVLVPMPWGALLFILVLGFVLSVVQTVVPQNSGDRVRFWSVFFNYLRSIRKDPTPKAETPEQPAVVEGIVIPPPLPLEPDTVTGPMTEARQLLGAEIKAQRKTRGMTVATVAEHLDCSTTKVARLEAGAVRPKKDDVEKLARLFEIPLEGRRRWLAYTLQAHPPAKVPAQRFPRSLKEVS